MGSRHKLRHMPCETITTTLKGIMMSDLLQNSKASRKQRAILALMQYPTLEKAAQAVGVHPTTIRRWMQQPEFRDALVQARREVFSQATGRLQQATQLAVTTLIKTMADTNTSASTRVQASTATLSQAAKAVELEDIATRLMALEEAVKAKSIK